MRGGERILTSNDDKTSPVEANTRLRQFPVEVSVISELASMKFRPKKQKKKRKQKRTKQQFGKESHTG